MTDVSATPHAPSRPGTGRVRPRALAFVALTKPRIVELLLVTTIPTMIVAEDGLPSVWLMIATFVGGALSAGGANAYNMYVDRDIDALMERTKGRPLVTGEVSPREALVFATAIEVAAFVLLATTVNLLSAVLALSAWQLAPLWALPSPAAHLESAAERPGVSPRAVRRRPESDGCPYRRRRHRRWGAP